MDQNNYPQNALVQASKALEGWKKAQKELNVPNMSMDDFENKMSLATGKVDLAKRLKIERSEAVEARNNSLQVLWEATKKVRNQAKATFGDVSDKMANFGVGRRSKKK